MRFQDSGKVDIKIWLESISALHELLQKSVLETENGSFHVHSLVQILGYSHFDLVSLLLALEPTGLVSEPALELINNHLISEQQKS